MGIVNIIVLSIRFILETITVIGLLSGGLIKKKLFEKILFIALGIAVFLIWSKYGAPKSPDALKGTAKLILEIVVYGIGIISFYNIFGMKTGIVYAAIVIIDLIMMYILNLQGN